MEGGGIPGLSKPMEFITFFAFRDLGLWEQMYGHVWSCMIHLGPYPPICARYFRYFAVPGRQNPGGAITISLLSMCLAWDATNRIGKPSDSDQVLGGY